jgi:hypothetical protein
MKIGEDPKVSKKELSEINCSKMNSLVSFSVPEHSCTTCIPHTEKVNFYSIDYVDEEYHAFCAYLPFTCFFLLSPYLWFSNYLFSEPYLPMESEHNFLLQHAYMVIGVKQTLHDGLLDILHAAKQKREPFPIAKRFFVVVVSQKILA